ncbi:oxygen-insensitive NADPH nitroreductase [Caldibacillus lycopersici]|uniref:Oxygen-insensitive NADPH nitroreductase n=1 Tax=Perspicuibacillus lycopersici TaxID=1325689 RepID=A0AAE3LPX8_9BACI|nr:oxygen-insensitive NADPH nitroreductase [Perspicuibacillus lycopersici]MCU9612804.1 oxygen-insensitive NADPH nitroreductase [Perspicuibacillus lycopersici]
MNATIETILAHRSVRDFEDKKLTKEQIETIVKCAQSASTSSFIQAYSIIGVTDQAKKDQLASVAGNQSYVAKNGHLFVFCADFYRHEVIGEMEDANILQTIESTEKFMVGLIDAALAAQNAALAAESMGLGICYIGGLRNDLPKVCELLEIRERVIPLFGMVVGYPAKMNEQKPRLPLEHLYHENRYEAEKESYQQQLLTYNETIKHYYDTRTAGERVETWTEQMARTLSRRTRMYMHEFVKQKGMNKH